MINKGTHVSKLFSSYWVTVINPYAECRTLVLKYVVQYHKDACSALDRLCTAISNRLNM